MAQTRPTGNGRAPSSRADRRLRSHLQALPQLTSEQPCPARERRASALGSPLFSHALIMLLTTEPSIAVECLNCGTIRRIEQAALRRGHTYTCPGCGYVGWALPAELTDQERRLLRHHLQAEPRSRLPRARQGPRRAVSLIAPPRLPGCRQGD